MAGQGLDRIPLRIPAEWSAEWFESFVREVLAQADVRNAVEGTGISIAGTSDEPATLAASTDILALLTASLITATPAPLLQQSRVLEAGPGIVIADGGAGNSITISAGPTLWYDIVGIPIYVESPNSPAWDYRIDGSVVGYSGIAGANDGIATGSLAGDLVLAPVDGRVYVAASHVFVDDAPLIIQRDISQSTSEYVGFQLNGRKVTPNTYGGLELRLENASSPSDDDFGLQIGLWEGGSGTSAPDADGVIPYPPTAPASGFRWRLEGSAASGADLVFYSHLGSASGAEVYRHQRNSAKMVFVDGSFSAPTIAFSVGANYGFYYDPVNAWLGIGANGSGIIGVHQTFVICGVPIRVVVGSAGAPTYTFNGDTDTGMYQAGANLLGFTAGGTARLSISTSQFTATLPWRGQDGSASAPALSFSSDTDLGVYRVGANALGISAGNSLVASFAQAEVELNATLLDFNGALDVSGTALFAGVATFTATGGGQSSALYVSANQPTLLLRSTTAAANSQKWQQSVIASQLNAHVVSDDDSAAARWLVVDGSSAGINSIGFDSAVILGAAATTPTHRLNTNTATGASAGADTLPANPVGFVVMNINGTDRKIPYYAT